MLISSTLKNWYLQKKRDLPWRNIQNPYYIWVSEIILQQTRIVQGIGYYERFVSRFPDVKTLADAPLEEVLIIWQGLGYYSRARNLHEGAKDVMENYNGILPDDYYKLLAIKGIGEYTAAAIGSIAFNLPVPAIDGNVIRVLSRIYGIHDPVDTANGKKIIRDIASSILDIEHPGLFNQSLMEFGAIQCKPQTPDCGVCPFQDSCYAKIHDETNLLPVKIYKQKIRTRYFNYLVILDKGFKTVFISQRTGKDIWQGLYEFPLIETDIPVEFPVLKNTSGWNELFYNSSPELLEIIRIKNYQLSHQVIVATCFILQTNGFTPAPKSARIIQLNEISRYPVSKLVDKFLQSFISKYKF